MTAVTATEAADDVVREVLARVLVQPSDIRAELRHVLAQEADALREAGARHAEVRARRDAMRGRLAEAQVTLGRVREAQAALAEAERLAGEQRALAVLGEGDDNALRAAEAAVTEARHANGEAERACADDLALVAHGRGPLAEAEADLSRAEADLTHALLAYIAARAAHAMNRARGIVMLQAQPWLDDAAAAHGLAARLLRRPPPLEWQTLARDGFTVRPSALFGSRQAVADLGEAVRKAARLPDGWRAPGND